MQSIRNPPPRPPSRLDHSNLPFPTQNNEVFIVAGIPEKLISSSHPFPPFNQQEQNKQNKVLQAPKKQQKINKKANSSQKQNLNDHVFRRKIQSDVVKMLDRIQNKQVPNKDKSLKKATNQKQNQRFTSSVQKKTNLQQINMPFSQVLRKSQTQVKNESSNVKIIDEGKSYARRVRQRIQAQNAKLEQRKKRRSIGQDAYIPYNLKELKQKIAQKSIRSSIHAKN